jgi:SHS2 domain-containing protein
MIFLISARRWVPARLRVVEADETRITADLKGAPLGTRKLEREIKAATFGALSVRRLSGGGLRATVILDV